MNGRKPTLRDYWWPEISDIETAKKAAHTGSAAGWFCAGATLLVIVMNTFGMTSTPLFNIGIEALFDVLLISALAYGTWNFSRVSAVGGIVLYWGEQIYTISQLGRTSPAMLIVLSLMFIKGVRGCFAYHEFKGAPTPLPTYSQTPLQPLGVEKSNQTTETHSENLENFDTRKSS